VTGQTSDYPSVADSGNKCTGDSVRRADAALQRGRGASSPDLRRVGTFDDPNLATPAMTIWTSSCTPLACIDTELPQVVKQPRRGVMSDA